VHAQQRSQFLVQCCLGEHRAAAVAANPSESCSRRYSPAPAARV
jgi:hypothetical protein